MTIDKMKLATLLATVDVMKARRDVARANFDVKEIERVVESYNAYVRSLEKLTEAVREAIS